jgi:hypothetical protein
MHFWGYEQPIFVLLAAFQKLISESLDAVRPNGLL